MGLSFRFADESPRTTTKFGSDNISAAYFIDSNFNMVASAGITDITLHPFFETEITRNYQGKKCLLIKIPGDIASNYDMSIFKFLNSEDSFSNEWTTDVYKLEVPPEEEEE